MLCLCVRKCLNNLRITSKNVVWEIGKMAVLNAMTFSLILQQFFNFLQSNPSQVVHCLKSGSGFANNNDIVLCKVNVEGRATNLIFNAFFLPALLFFLEINLPLGLNRGKMA